ncbi:shikimate kinase [Tetragenococcus muriaticus]|uniref:Shikimate kinase n=2 Tax=Tetragenococcus muriaticus TaxID=64642 RepID=A0A091C259_9ENTE|nr:shikimate kinase [Tetragenococcus muriaticus]KFN91024.1 shikimate kinase [Tetragenococcus muriaticus 3MR10-3]KFN91479.1 shikimate kinase [Tetragenococcus muriaticus PMC-11-5]GMA47141.1 shikimate kinase [Tetragenococcus muriaticus]
MENIILIGFMGAGKTTIGHLLAQELNTQQHDFDEILVEKIGMSIDDYFRYFGSESFRENVFYLKTDFEELIHRISSDQQNLRPLAESKTSDEIHETYLPRVTLYEESARFIIETSKKQPKEIVQEILDKVEVL